MTFPWKKPKSSLLSRLLPDLHPPAKRRPTLVIETGFPTSLVDLIVKNRDRFTKSPKRKSGSRIQTPLTSLPPRSSLVPPCDRMLQSSHIDAAKLVLVHRECAGGSTFAFRMAFKVIIVAALAVSSRQLTFWIMMVAFLLLLLEYVGASVFGLLLRKFHAISLGSRIGKGLSEQTPSTEELFAKQQETVFPDSVESIDSDCVQEIQIVGSEFNCAGKTQIVEEIETRRERRGLCRSGRFKTHMVKKLRHGMKNIEDYVS